MRSTPSTTQKQRQVYVILANHASFLPGHQNPYDEGASIYSV